MERTRRTGEMGIETPQIEEITATRGEGEDGARVIRVRVLLGVLAVLVLAGFTNGCGSDSDQDQGRQEAKEKADAKGQRARQEVKKKVNEKKQEVKKKVEAK
jgi:hypothetical protein